MDFIQRQLKVFKQESKSMMVFAFWTGLQQFNVQDKWQEEGWPEQDVRRGEARNFCHGVHWSQTGLDPLRGREVSHVKEEEIKAWGSPGRNPTGLGEIEKMVGRTYSLEGSKLEFSRVPVHSLKNPWSNSDDDNPHLEQLGETMPPKWKWYNHPIISFF